MGSLGCACGQRLSDQESDKTFLLIDAQTLGILEESAGGGAVDVDDVALIKDSPTVYTCSNCGRAVVEGLELGRVRYFREVDPIPRIWVDPSDRDGLGRIRLRHERTLAQLQENKLMPVPGVELIGVWEGGELRGRMHFAVDDAEVEITDCSGNTAPPGGWALEPDVGAGPPPGYRGRCACRKRHPCWSASWQAWSR